MDSIMKERRFNSSKFRKFTYWCQGFFLFQKYVQMPSASWSSSGWRQPHWFGGKVLWISVTSVTSGHCHILQRELQLKQTGQLLNNFIYQVDFNLLSVNTSYKVKNNGRRKLFLKNVSYVRSVQTLRLSQQEICQMISEEGIGRRK